MKYINFKRYKFSTAAKNFNDFKNNLFKFFKFIDFRKIDFKKLYKFFDLRKFNIKTTYKFSDLKYLGIKFLKELKFLKNKIILIHLPAAIIFFSILYFIIPVFYSYDKSLMEKVICKSQSIECVIKGKVKYSFYPTPRIKVKDLVVNDITDKKYNLINVQNAVIKVSFKNLLAKERHSYKKIELSNFEINLNLKKYKNYKNIFKSKNNFLPVIFKKGKIIFYDEKNYVASINNVNLNLKILNNDIEGILDGNFLDDKIYIKLNSKKKDKKEFTDLILKMNKLNFLVKANFFDSEKDKNILSSNVLIKKGKNRLTGIIDFKKNQLSIKKSNIKNSFIDGRLSGDISIFPFFDFNLDLNLNSINFTKLYNYFLSLEKENKKKFFKISEKINGKLSLSSEKIYSSNNLVRSFESQLKFNNSNILVDQFLMNMGKLGAADFVGSINNEKKFSNLKFESNVFVDNQKKFLSKFGIYNKKVISPNFFVSGSLDLENLRMSFYEIFSDTKLSNEDVNYIESEFNEIMTEDDYKSLLNFSKFKVFIKSINSEEN